MEQLSRTKVLLLAATTAIGEHQQRRLLSVISICVLENSEDWLFFYGLNVISGYTTWGLLISLQPPFYPLEAEEKGASPQQVT